MKTVKNTLSVNFYLNKTKVNKEGKSPIVARITLNTKWLQFSTGKVIEESRWNGLKGIAKGSKVEVARLNNFLANFHAKISEAYERLNVQNKLMTLEDLKTVIEGKFNGTWTMLKLIGYHNESESELLEWGTMKNYMTTQKYLLSFIKKRYGYDDYNLSNLNYQFLTDFNLFLRKRWKVKFCLLKMTFFITLQNCYMIRSSTIPESYTSFTLPRWMESRQTNSSYSMSKQ